MTKVKIEGTVHAIGDVKSFGANGFRKRDVVVEVQGGKYSDTLPVEFAGELAETSASLSLGEHIVVDGYLSGRPWQKDASAPVKYFLSIKAASFSVNGQNVVKEPDATPAYVMDDTLDVPF